MDAGAFKVFGIFYVDINKRCHVYKDTVQKVLIYIYINNIYK